jgi:hypothetical protein
MLCIGVNKIKIHFDTSQLCCGVVHFNSIGYIDSANYILIILITNQGLNPCTYIKNAEQKL